MPSRRTDAPSAGLADRYGRRPGPARGLRTTVLALLLLAFTAGVVVVGWQRATAPVSFKELAFAVPDDGTVRVTWEVARDPGRDVECVVRARGADGAEVGNEAVSVPASDARRTVVTHDLPTTARAVTGEVRSCIDTGPR